MAPWRPQHKGHPAAKCFQVLSCVSGVICSNARAMSSIRPLTHLGCCVECRHGSGCKPAQKVKQAQSGWIRRPSRGIPRPCQHWISNWRTSRDQCGTQRRLQNCASHWTHFALCYGFGAIFKFLRQWRIHRLTPTSASRAWIKKWELSCGEKQLLVQKDQRRNRLAIQVQI